MKKQILKPDLNHYFWVTDSADQDAVGILRGIIGPESFEQRLRLQKHCGDGEFRDLIRCTREEIIKAKDSLKQLKGRVQIMLVRNGGDAYFAKQNEWRPRKVTLPCFYSSAHRWRLKS